MRSLPRLLAGRRVVAPAVLLFALAPVPAAALAANPGTATTKAGQTLNVRIDVPANGASVGSGALDVSGVAGIGTLSGGTGTNLLYVVDNSGSTSSTVGDCNGDGATNDADDFNGDKALGNVLDCEISGAVALNSSIAKTAVEVGAIAFGSTADTGDMSPSSGQQDFARVTTDANGNGRSDAEDVLRSIGPRGFGQFTATTTSGGGTSFNGAITKVNAAFAGKSGRNIVAFLSDGSDSITEGAGSPIETARAAGTQINTYSVGTSAVGCGTASALKRIADITGGTCTEVKDPTLLSTTIVGGAGAGLQGVKAAVNGGAAAAATTTALGTWSLRVPAGRLKSGANTISATATATDGTTAKAQITVYVGSGATPGTAVGLPSNARCISKRLFPIKVRQVKGLRYDFATIVVNGKKVRVYVRKTKTKWIRTGRPRGALLNVKVFRAYVDLRGLVKGRYTVKIVVVATNGRVITGKRTYRTCTRRLTGTVPKL